MGTSAGSGMDLAGDFLLLVSDFFVRLACFLFLIVVVGALLDFVVCFRAVGGEELMSLVLFAAGEELSKYPGGGDGVRERKDDSGEESALVEDCILRCAWLVLLGFVGDPPKDVKKGRWREASKLGGWFVLVMCRSRS